MKHKGATVNYRRFASDYVNWDGGPCPCPGQKVHVIFRSGSRTEGFKPPARAENFAWLHRKQDAFNDFDNGAGEISHDVRRVQSPSDIVAFRVITKNPPRHDALERYLASVTLVMGPGNLPVIQE